MFFSFEISITSNSSEPSASLADESSSPLPRTIIPIHIESGGRDSPLGFLKPHRLGLKSSKEGAEDYGLGFQGAG